MHSMIASGSIVAGLMFVGPQTVLAQAGANPSACVKLAVNGRSNPSDPLNDVVPVTYVSGPTAVYPTALRKHKIAGVVGLTFVVRCDGRADSTTIVVVSATDSAFVAPAIRAVLQSIYRPAVFRGQKVATTVPQSVRFKAESLP